MAPFNSQLDEFFEKYNTLRKMLHSFFCKEGLGEEAEDLTSEVIKILYQKVSNKNSKPFEKGIQAYAFGIAHKLRFNTYTNRQKKPQFLEDIKEDVKAKYSLLENSLDDKLDKEKYFYYMHKCADELKLSSTDRLIIFNDDSDNDEELAEKIGESVENVRTRRCRLRKQIIECVRKHLKRKK